MSRSVGDMAIPDFRKIMDALKVLLRRRKIRYHAVADHLGISETSIKRMFGGTPCNIAKIMKICELCDISFFELINSIERPSETNYYLTEEQELHFVKWPGHFAIFRDLKLGLAIGKIQEKWKLKSDKLYRILRQLEKLGLIEVKAGNQAKVLVDGMIRVRDNGPFAREVTFGQNVKLMQYVFDHMRDPTVCFHSVEAHLTEDQIKQFTQDIHELGRRYRIQAQQSQRLYPVEQLSSVRWLLAFSKYETDWTEYGT